MFPCEVKWNLMFLAAIMNAILKNGNFQSLRTDLKYNSNQIKFINLLRHLTTGALD